MENRKIKLLIPFALGSLVLGGLFFFLARGYFSSAAPEPIVQKQVEHGNDDEHDDEEIIFDGDAVEAAGIRTAIITESVDSVMIPFSGQIAAHPDGTVRVASLVSGRVVRLPVAAGDRVRKGQVLAVIESRAVGEAQSAHEQAVTRFETAKSNLSIIRKQVRAGVFSRAPLEAAHRALVEAQAELRSQETAVRTAQENLENTERLARSGEFSHPAVEAAQSQVSSAREAVESARAALEQAQSNVKTAASELERRKQQSAAGAYVSRPVEEARRVVVASQSARAAAQSELTTTRANLDRMRSLFAEGLVSQRDLETAQQSFETAQARIEAARSDEEVASEELKRRQKLASTNITGSSEVQAAQSELERAQAEVRARQSQLNRATDALKLTQTQSARQQQILKEDIANRREVGPAKSTLESAKNARAQAKAKLELASTAYEREKRISRESLNDASQLQSARAQYAQAQSDLRAARNALTLFKSTPGKNINIPITAPISGTVQERTIMLGELLSADTVLMTLVDLNPVAVEITLPESEAMQIGMHAEVSVEIDVLPERSFRGKIDFIDSQLDSKTRTLKVRALLPNASGVLRPGLFARGRIQAGSHTKSLTVPDEAIQEMEGQKVLFIASEQPNRFIKRPVKTGPAKNGRTLIESGLDIGEKIVVEGAFMVKAQAMKAELGHSH